MLVRQVRIFSAVRLRPPGFLEEEMKSAIYSLQVQMSPVFGQATDYSGYVNSSGHVIWGPTVDSPDHSPLLGWSEEDKTKSCEGFTESTRSTVASFPEP